MGNLSKHFDVQEFVPESIYKLYGDRSRWFIDPKIIGLAEYIRGYFDEPVTINNWHVGGRFQERGFRVSSTQTGAKYSQHKFGRAIDFNVKGIEPGEVSKAIIENQDNFMLFGLTTIENPEFTKTWTHLDTRNTGSSELLIVNP